MSAAAPAAAAAARQSPVQDPTASFVVPRQEQVAAEFYWTAERQQRAVQGDVLTRLPGVPPWQRQPTSATTTLGLAPATAQAPAAVAGTEAGTTTVGGPLRAPSSLANRQPNPLAAPPTSTGAAYTQGGQVSRSAGKLFVTLGGVDYACSASIVTSVSRDLAVTAGHCLHGGGTAGRFATNVVFAPGYSGGSAPYGLWSARRIVTTSGWSASRNFDLDVGFIALNTRNNLHVQQVVGSLGIFFNLPRSNYQWAFGYPALPPYNGGRLSYCAGLPVPDPHGGTALGLRCTMTAGASGGPWMVGMSRYAPGHGFVDSVVSYNYQEDPTRLYGPYFGNAVRALYATSSSM